MTAVRRAGVAVAPVGCLTTRGGAGVPLRTPEGGAVAVCGTGGDELGGAWGLGVDTIVGVVSCGTLGLVVVLRGSVTVGSLGGWGSAVVGRSTGASVGGPLSPDAFTTATPAPVAALTIRQLTNDAAPESQRRPGSL